MTWALLAVSVVLNGTTHYLESTHTAPSWLLVVAVAAVPPSVLGLTVHLAVDMRRPGRLDDPAASSTGPVSPSPEVTHATTAAGDTPRDTQGTSADPLTELIQQGAGRRTIASQLGVTEYEARKLIAASRNGSSQ